MQVIRFNNFELSKLAAQMAITKKINCCLPCQNGIWMISLLKMNNLNLSMLKAVRLTL